MLQPLHIKNAHIWLGDSIQQQDLSCRNVLLPSPAKNSQVVDLDGYLIIPGLINAHDHLELNHYPRTKFRDVYNNAHQWGKDVNRRLNTELYKSLRAYPLWDRLFIGGLKNLLCGATTVIHHGPPHKAMFRKNFPVRVLKDYGWAHSLHFNTDDEVIKSYKSTPLNVPWFIHLAEGTDELAAKEYKKLKQLGCAAKNTVIVHGVGLTKTDFSDAMQIVQGIVWCPSTNLYLIGNTNDQFIQYFTRTKGTSKIVLGSDSRLTANGDLLDEIRCAAALCKAFMEQQQTSAETQSELIYSILSLVTTGAAKCFNLLNRGHLKVNSVADFFVIRLSKYGIGEIYKSCRNDIALIVKGGIPQIGNPELMVQFAHIETVDAILDGSPKKIHIELAKQISKCKLKEHGLEIDTIPKKRFFFF